MIEPLVQHECFFYGLPAKYALVDSLRYEILMVSDQCYNLVFVKKLFETKRNLAVVKLHENTIDNSVAIGWGFKKIVGKDLFPNKGELVITPWSKIIDFDANDVDLVDSVTGELLMCNDVPVTEDKINFVKQLLMGAEVAYRIWYHPVAMTEPELEEIWQVFSVSLNVDTLVANMLELGRRWYAQDNLHGSIIFNTLPEKYRYE